MYRRRLLKQSALKRIFKPVKLSLYCIEFWVKLIETGRQDSELGKAVPELRDPWSLMGYGIGRSFSKRLVMSGAKRPLLFQIGKKTGVKMQRQKNKATIESDFATCRKPLCTSSACMYCDVIYLRGNKWSRDSHQLGCFLSILQKHTSERKWFSSLWS